MTGTRERSPDEDELTVTLAHYDFGFDEYTACGEAVRWAARSCADGTVAWKPCVPDPGLEGA
jgi:hypothetical protein